MGSKSSELVHVEILSTLNSVRSSLNFVRGAATSNERRGAAGGFAAGASLASGRVLDGAGYRGMQPAQTGHKQPIHVLAPRTSLAREADRYVLVKPTRQTRTRFIRIPEAKRAQSRLAARNQRLFRQL